MFLSLAAELNPNRYCDPGLSLATLTVCTPSLNPLCRVLGPLLLGLSSENAATSRSYPLCNPPLKLCSPRPRKLSPYSPCSLIANTQATSHPPPPLSFSASHKHQRSSVAFYMGQSFTSGFEIILFCTCYQKKKKKISSHYFCPNSLEESPQLLFSPPADSGAGAL